jgi:NADH-quinone oxidoreductase subunit N
MGFLVLGILAGTETGYGASLFYAISYTIMTLGSFGMILLLARAGYEAEEIDDFRGLNQRAPWFALLMSIVMFSLAGVPPLFGFFAKFVVLKAAVDADQLWLAVVAAVFAIVGIYYYLRVVKVMYFDAPASDAALPLPSDRPMRWVISGNALALLALGLCWGPLYSWCTRASGL